MGILPGPLATSPGHTTLPSEVVRVLGKAALPGASAYVHIRSGLDSLLGDTHLVVIEGKLHVVARRSSLDALEPIALEALPVIDETGYRSVLVLATNVGARRVEIGATEENAVHALVDALPDGAVATHEAAVSAPPPPPGDAVEDGATAEAERDAARGALLTTLAQARPSTLASDVRDARNALREARRALLSVLAARREARTMKLRADRVALARTDRRAAHAAASAAREAADDWLPGAARRDLARRAVPSGDRPEPAPPNDAREIPPEPAGSSILPWVVLVLLTLVGFIAVMARLFSRGS